MASPDGSFNVRSKYNTWDCDYHGGKVCRSPWIQHIALVGSVVVARMFELLVMVKMEC